MMRHARDFDSKIRITLRENAKIESKSDVQMRFVMHF